MKDSTLNLFFSATNGLYDIRGPITLWPDWLLFALMGGVLVLGLVAYFSLRAYWRRPAQPSVPEKSPQEIAMQELEQLRDQAKDLPPEPFSVKVTQLLRSYLEDAFHIPAPEQTSEEFLLSVEKDPRFPGDIRDSLPSFMERCDLVKFARQDLNTNEKFHLLQNAENIVKLPIPENSTDSSTT